MIVDEYDINQECEFFEKVLEKKGRKNILLINDDNDDVAEQDDSPLLLN